MRARLPISSGSYAYLRSLVLACPNNLDRRNSGGLSLSRSAPWAARRCHRIERMIPSRQRLSADRFKSAGIDSRCTTRRSALPVTSDSGWKTTSKLQRLTLPDPSCIIRARLRMRLDNQRSNRRTPSSIQSRYALSLKRGLRIFHHNRSVFTSCPSPTTAFIR